MYSAAVEEVYDLVKEIIGGLEIKGNPWKLNWN
jgi:hypothetical protein